MCGTAPGGRLEPLHAVSMLGVPQPCRQALCEFSIACPPFACALCVEAVRRNASTGVNLLVWQGDRFIPNRSAMDMDMAHYLLTEPRKDKKNAPSPSPSPGKEAYRKLLAERLLNNPTRILAFQNRLEDNVLTELRADAASIQDKPAKQRRYIAQVRHALLWWCSLVFQF